VGILIRVTDVMDSKSDAPGANDDGSGVAAMMELTKIMSKRSFPYTIHFVVTGEEQGLYGSRHLAELAKEENWNIVAMLNNDMIGNSLSSGTNLETILKLESLAKKQLLLRNRGRSKNAKANQ
jgi:Zn-dependent M28 family amino/carboxypeptidase